MQRVHLAVLNITSWSGQCADAIHVYGNLILSTQDKVTIDNVEDWNVKYLGENIEITQPMTLDLAIKLDQIDGGKSYQRAYHMKEQVKDDQDFDEYLNTIRFETFEQVVNAGIKKWKELNIDCPFISLYDGTKYKANSYEPSNTVILQYQKE